MNLIQKLRKSGIYCESLEHIPAPLKHLYSEMIYEASSLVHYRRSDMFLSVAVETTSICNRTCSFCPNTIPKLKQQRPQKEMSEQVFMRLMKDLSQIHYRDIVSFQHYGEPLLDTQLEDRIKLARRLLPQAYLQIKSNGDYLSVKKFQHLTQAGLNEIFVTIYNPDGKLTSNMKNLAEYLLWHPQERSCLSIRSTPNYFYNRGGLVTLPKTAQVQLKYCIQESHCLNVNVEGDIVKCSNDYLGQNSFGNILEENIMSIWNSPRYKQHRQEIRTGIFQDDLCKRCTL